MSDKSKPKPISLRALCPKAETRSPAVARMADHTAPVVKLTLALTGHNLAKTGTFPLNGPIMRQNEAY